MRFPDRVVDLATPFSTGRPSRLARGCRGRVLSGRRRLGELRERSVEGVTGADPGAEHDGRWRIVSTSAADAGGVPRPLSEPGANSSRAMWCGRLATSDETSLEGLCLAVI
jgi:hypothetical protein